MGHHRLRPITDTLTPMRLPTRIPIMDTIRFRSVLDSMGATDSVADLAAIEASGAKLFACFTLGGLAAAGLLVEFKTQSKIKLKNLGSNYFPGQV